MRYEICRVFIDLAKKKNVRMEAKVRGEKEIAPRVVSSSQVIDDTAVVMVVLDRVYPNPSPSPCTCTDGSTHFYLASLQNYFN